VADFWSTPHRWDPDELTPKYLRICRVITEGIEAGQLRPGEALPSQKDMAEHFAVTLMTLRQALRVLADQEHLRIEHGRGTFVADPVYRLPLDGLSSLTEQIVGTKRRLRSEIVDARDVPAPKGVPARMGLDSDTVFQITRLRWVDDQPLMYSMSLLHPADGHRLDLERMGEASLYDALAEQLGILVVRAVESFRATALGSVEAAALARTPGQPALVSSRLTYDATGRAVLDDRVIMPGDGVVVATERRVDDVDLRLRLPVDDPLVPLVPLRPHPTQEK
jgi:GntR family transcriptional regulator